jgi:hypothetical protein
VLVTSNELFCKGCWKMKFFYSTVYMWGSTFGSSSNSISKMSYFSIRIQWWFHESLNQKTLKFDLTYNLNLLKSKNLSTLVFTFVST